MSQIGSLFASCLYQAARASHAPAIDAQELEASCRTIPVDGKAGQPFAKLIRRFITQSCGVHDEPAGQAERL